MMALSQLEMIPISALTALDYCPRSFYYQIVQGETLVTASMLEGQLALRRAQQPGECEVRRLYLFSEALHLTGFALVIEEPAGRFIPVEYSQKQQGSWQSEQLQLCAQALCLEERQPGTPPLPYGYIITLHTGRRTQVPFTAQLRARTKATIQEALRVAAQESSPPPLTGKLASRCPQCSLLPICLPEEVRQLRAAQGQ
ncbi:MAG TPA: CRISPR-associated protein Cas4 [Ktedonosporobacter sp.]|jgi:CRISPR-associated exonuclease Cas4|nr:CRISPR-associated protein Cas4 [Ktedonosporobacter sp.]